MKKREITRRKFLKCACVAAAAGPFIRIGSVRGADQVVIVSWGGSYQDAQRQAHFEPFEKATGTKVIEIKEGPRIAKLKAQIEGGMVEWDVMDFETSDLLRAAEQGLLEPIDRSIVDSSEILPSAVHEFGIANVSWSKILAFSTKKYPQSQPHPDGWADFWNIEKWPGRRGLQDLVKPNLEFALLADGVSKEKLYPLDVDRAFRSLDRIRPHITAWWSKTAQAIQLLVDGEVDMNSAPNGRILAPKAKGIPIDLTWSGGALDFDWWCVPRGAKNKRAAMEFINFAIKAKGQAELAKLVPYGPSNKRAWDYIDPDLAANLPTAPENLAKQFVLNNQWWLRHEVEVIKRWQSWKILSR